MNLHTLNTQDPAPEKGSVQEKTNTLFVKQLDNQTAQAYVSDSYGKVLKIVAEAQTAEITPNPSSSAEKFVTNVETENIYNENTIVKFSFSDGTQTSFEIPKNLNALVEQSNFPMYHYGGGVSPFVGAVLGTLRDAFMQMNWGQMQDFFMTMFNNSDFNSLLEQKINEILSQRGF